jgi:diguanylate cyclase (GGDEF)-like protein
MGRLTLLRNTTLRAKFLFINAVVVLPLAWLSAQAWRASSAQELAQAQQVALAFVLQRTKQADMLHDALHAQVLAALLANELPGNDPARAQAELQRDSAELNDALREIAARSPLPELATLAQASVPVAQRYTQVAQQIADTARSQRSEALKMLPQLKPLFDELLQRLDAQAEEISTALGQAQALAAEQAAEARQGFLWISLLTIVLTSALVASITAMVRRRLVELGAVAQAIATGDFARRVASKSSDEIGQVGHAIDRMAQSLAQMLDSVREDARRAGFGRDLAAALDMADREPQVCSVTARAMVEISPVHGMELLVCDSSRAHLERAATHPVAGAPGCGVGSPYDCVAVRRGTVVSFATSEALGACEHLRGRPCGSLSAVCVPVTFMGRAIGVLHAAGSVDEPLHADQAQQLGTLGTQIGMRIGTVRAFEKTQIQAATDTLTGLPNRRTLEHKLHGLSQGDQAFAVVMCDLDRFKMLNDTHGHAAGDNALRVFAEALRHSVRGNDTAGRWGGEEFAIVLGGTDAAVAHAMVERLRQRLAQLLRGGQSPSFTASFGIADSTMSRHPATLVHLADTALYEAKALGRDQARVADAAAAPFHHPAPSRNGAGAGIGHDAVVDASV